MIIVKNREGRRNSYTIDFEAFRRFPRWSPGRWQMPVELVDIAVKGLKFLSERARVSGTAPATARKPAVGMRAVASGI